MRLKQLLVWLALAACSWAQAQPTLQGPTLPPQRVDGILAVVGDKIIMRSEFETEKMQLARGRELPDSLAAYCAILDQLIIDRLLLNQAEIDSLPLGDDRIESEIDNRIREYQRMAGSLVELERYLGKTITEFKDEIRPKMRNSLLAQEMRSTITDPIRISPQEVKQFYESIPEDSLPIINTEVEVAQLIIEPPVSEVARAYAKEQLEDLRARILRGESFERLAKAYSMDPGSKNNGGLLPEFGRGEMVGAFERMAFKLKDDSLSPVFESDYGFHIMKLIKRKGDRVLAAHILIRPEYTSSDFIAASASADSIYTELTEGRLEWCTAVKAFTSETYGDKAYCGYLSDEVTGLQKTAFDELPSDIKQQVEKMEAGTYSAPKLTVTPDGRSVYRILYVKSFIAPHEANLIQDYSRIQMEAEAQKKQEALDAWVDKYKSRTYIRVNDPGFDCPSLDNWNRP